MHWTQTKEGRKMMSRIQRARQAARKRTDEEPVPTIHASSSASIANSNRVAKQKTVLEALEVVADLLQKTTAAFDRVETSIGNILSTLQ